MTTLTLHRLGVRLLWTPKSPGKIWKTLVADDDHLRARNYLSRGIDSGTSPSCNWIPRQICFNQTRNCYKVLPKTHSTVPSAAFSNQSRQTVYLFPTSHLQRHPLLVRPGGIASHSSIPLGRDIYLLRQFQHGVYDIHSKGKFADCLSSSPLPFMHRDPQLTTTVLAADRLSSSRR